jgi:hypothetical protein
MVDACIQATGPKPPPVASIEAAVMEFFERLADGEEFTSEDLHRFVDFRYGSIKRTSPQTGMNLMYKLKREGFAAYRVVDRSARPVVYKKLPCKKMKR